MKVILIHGQNHKGSSYHMGRVVAENMAEQHEIREFFLPKDLNHFCAGCYQCIEEEEKCPFWNEKKEIMDAMEQAEVFIFTTPNYCLAPSGSMKAFLDLFFDLWMVHRPKKWMFEKKAIILSASAGASCKKAMQPVRDSLFYWGIPYIKMYGKAVHAANWKMVKPEQKEKLERDLVKLARKVKRKGKPSVGIKTKFIFMMMKMMHKKGWDSSPVEGNYWKEQGWYGKIKPWK